MSEHNRAPFAFRKNGIYYFRRRIPADLEGHYRSNQIAYSLRTRSPRVAASRAARAAQRLDEHWYHLRLLQADLPGRHLLRAAPVAFTPSVRESPESPTDTLSDAVTVYLRLKGKDRPVAFHRAARRSCGYVIEACGDKPLAEYTRADANLFRDSLIERGLAGSSITRVLGTVRAIYNFAANEAGVDLKNPFGGVWFDRQAGVKDRLTIPREDRIAVKDACRRMNDDLRWLVALVSDSGMRLAKAAGLALADFTLDDGCPRVEIREHPWRRLKTPGSKRVVPLVGASLWAARRVVEHKDPEGLAFPRYNRTGETKASAASAALNKWMRPLVSDSYTMHSFRHALRDRLRAVECPSDIVDQIGGWQTEGIGHGYGEGYPLDVLAKWMKRIEET